MLLLIILMAGSAYYLYFLNNQRIDGLISEKEEINEQYLQTKKDLDAANLTITAKEKEVEDLKQAKNNAVRNDVVSTNQPTNQSTTTQKASSIYDRITGTDEFKSKIVAALNALSAQDNEHFQMTSSQVETINEYNNFGGYQEKRNIFIGADANPAITGSIISHEAMHVYNVYVNKIWSYHTREQELPSYEAELVTAQRLGAPEFFITSVQSSIDYWKTQ